MQLVSYQLSSDDFTDGNAVNFREDGKKVLKMAEYYYSSKDILDKAIGTDAYFHIKSILTSTKAADVAPVRHGRWKWCKDYDGDSILVCSECGRVCHEEDAPYCYCGCKMDLEEPHAD